MADQTTPVEASADHRSKLQRELDARDEEILRLRDLLIARDAELGAARGRLAMMETSSQRLAGLAARIPVPGATRLLQGLIRLLQGGRG
jgi:septal ring factor EnvC (AmiA/AmiB activator)